MCDWRLTGSPAAWAVDTIKEPSDVAQGGSDLSTHTQRNALLRSVLWFAKFHKSCSQISQAEHPVVFHSPSTRGDVRLLWPRKFKMISEDARSM